MTVFEQLDTEGGATLMQAAQGTHGRLTPVGTGVTQAHHRQLRHEAAVRQCSVAAIVREAVVEWLRANSRAG